MFKRVFCGMNVNYSLRQCFVGVSYAKKVMLLLFVRSVRWFITVHRNIEGTNS